MSTQVLNDVQLVTKQEMEAALDAVVTPEATIDSKIASAKTEVENDLTTTRTSLTELITSEANARKSADDLLSGSITTTNTNLSQAVDTLNNSIDAEAELRSTTDTDLRNLITTEVSNRTAGDEALAIEINAEKDARAAGDTNITNMIATLKEKTTNTYDGGIASCVKLVGLPIAQVTITNNDKTLQPGDILISLGATYLPVIPVTFHLTTELTEAGESVWADLTLNLNAGGDVVVVNKTFKTIASTDTLNSNSATIMYITKE